MSDYPNLNVCLKAIRIDNLWLMILYIVRLGVEMHRRGASKFRNKPKTLLRLRLSTSNPISVRGLSHYRRGISRCYFHSQRNTALLSRRASRLRTRLQWPSLLTWEESVEIRPGCRYRGSDGIPAWSMGYCLFLASFSQHSFCTGN